MRSLPARFKSPFVWVPLLCFAVYLVLVRPGQLNYFRDLAEALLQGRLDLGIPKNTHDLVLFQGKYYLYWPPVPALVWSPIVALTGGLIADGIVGAVAGAVNVALAMQLLRYFSQRAGQPLSNKTLAWAGIFWGLGTVQFHLAPPGNTWFFAQTIAQTFLLAALFIFVKKRQWFWSGLLLALAIYSRNNLIFSFLFFALLYGAEFPEIPWRKRLRPAVLFVLPFLLLSALNACYNYVRFGDAFENGLQYHLMDPYFLKNYEAHGYFSIHYLPYNFYVQVLHAPTFIPRVPFVMPEPEGFSFVWASPLFFLLIPALLIWIKLLFSRKTDSYFRKITLACWLTTLPIAFTIFLIMGTGWRQYGARYTFDFHFFLLLFLALLWPFFPKYRWLPVLGAALVVMSVAMQAAGIP